ncbi:hypothetical protein [Haloferula sp.]|uniref:hypothetical protein n=1 Tax=Haloferula sp. TaxID=2497595 RepID=UPI00329A8A75
MKARHLPIALIASLLTAGSATAGTTSVGPVAEGPTMTHTTSNDWELTLGLYFWAAGLDGDIGAAGSVAAVDIPFSDILDSLDMTVMGMVEARKGRWIFQLEGLYIRNSVKGLADNGTVNTTAKLTAKTTRIAPVVGYRLIENDCTKLDLVAGITYYNISNKIQTYGPAAVRGVKANDDWIDPVIGLRLNQRLSERWSLQVRGDVGGFGVKSDFLWQALGLVGYNFTDSTVGYVGYRHAAVDYQNGGFIYDVATSGPIMGVAITW